MKSKHLELHVVLFITSVMKYDMQISYEMVSNAHVHQLTVSL